MSAALACDPYFRKLEKKKDLVKKIKRAFAITCVLGLFFTFVASSSRTCVPLDPLELLDRKSATRGHCHFDGCILTLTTDEVATPLGSSKKRALFKPKITRSTGEQRYSTIRDGLPVQRIAPTGIVLKGSGASTNDQFKEYELAIVRDDVAACVFDRLDTTSSV